MGQKSLPVFLNIDFGCSLFVEHLLKISLRLLGMNLGAKGLWVIKLVLCVLSELVNRLSSMLWPCISIMGHRACQWNCSTLLTAHFGVSFIHAKVWRWTSLWFYFALLYLVQCCAGPRPRSFESLTRKWQSNTGHLYSLAARVRINSIEFVGIDALRYGICLVEMPLHVISTASDLAALLVTVISRSVKLLQIERSLGWISVVLDGLRWVEVLLGGWHLILILLLSQSLWLLDGASHSHGGPKPRILSYLAWHFKLSPPCILNELLWDIASEAASHIHGIHLKGGLSLANCPDRRDESLRLQPTKRHLSVVLLSRFLVIEINGLGVVVRCIVPHSITQKWMSSVIKNLSHSALPLSFLRSLWLGEQTGLELSLCQLFGSHEAIVLEQCVGGLLQRGERSLLNKGQTAMMRVLLAKGFQTGVALLQMFLAVVNGEFVLGLLLAEYWYGFECIE